MTTTRTSREPPPLSEVGSSERARYTPGDLRDGIGHTYGSMSEYANIISGTHP